LEDVLPLEFFSLFATGLAPLFPSEFSLFCKAFSCFFLLALFRLPLSNIQQRLMHPLSLASFSEWNGLASAKAKAS